MLRLPSFLWHEDGTRPHGARAEGGDDTIGNAIALCFERHAEVHAYNPKHPRGRRFRAEELREHKEQWLRICRERPEVFVAPTRHADVGPLQALIDELEFNLVIASGYDEDDATAGPPFAEEQFRQAIGLGAIPLLDETLKDCILEAYALMRFATYTLQKPAHDHASAAIAELAASRRVVLAQEAVVKAHAMLLRFLASETVAAEAPPG